jgi:hypothetical protein
MMAVSQNFCFLFLERGILSAFCQMKALGGERSREMRSTGRIKRGRRWRSSGIWLGKVKVQKNPYFSYI